jgi:hypothetical protein
MMSTEQAMYPTAQRGLLIEQFLRDVQAKADEGGIDTDAAFLNVAIGYLGFDLDDGFRTDGSGDYGFDYVDVGEREATIIQSKSVQFGPGSVYEGTNVFGPDKISDLYRIKEVLGCLTETPAGATEPLRKALDELRTQVMRAGRAAQQALGESFQAIDEALSEEARQVPPIPSQTNSVSALGIKEAGPQRNEDASPYTIQIILVGMAKRLSEAALQEVDRIFTTTSIEYHNVKISITFRIVLIDDLISERWRKENDKWRDRNGKQREKIRFKISEKSMLRPGNGSFVFFTRATDLVKAYEDFGYQLFEPNVRAEIHNSTVNKEIKRSVKSHRGRQEFRHLNNGLTIIAEGTSFVGPKDKPDALDLLRPGIVNGLQTVKSLHDAFKELTDPEDQKHFEENCTVLCRIHGPNAVRDVNLLIKATNNQNPMKPRNLRSNDPEQLTYEQLFAEFGWFYERKEGAWRAFKDNPKGWPKLRGKQAKHFRSGKAERVVDNEVLAQNWLCFIGFSKDAINEKRAIFSPDNDDLYRLSFLLRAQQHGNKYNYRIRDAVDKAIKESPSPAALMIAHLGRELYEFLTPGPKEARQEAIARLGTNPNEVSKEEIETKLVNDDTYMTVRVMNGTKVLFIEFLGYIMMEVWGEALHRAAREILQRGAFGELFRHHRFDQLRAVVDSKTYAADEAVICIYQTYRECIYRLVTDPGWRRQYDAALVKSRFLYDDKSRSRLIQELITVDELIGRRRLGQPWSDHFDDANGIFKFLNGWLNKPIATAPTAIQSEMPI